MNNGIVMLRHQENTESVSARVVNLNHGYDNVGNRLYREDTEASDASVHQDELYAYDGLHRLTDMQLGNVNTEASPPTIASVGFRHNWGLDQLGNWAMFNEDEDGDGTSGGWELEQTRTHNKVNEITGISATTGLDWLDPVHDAAGNMTQGPRPGDEDDQDGAEQRYTYDAWNRMVKVERRDYEEGTPQSWSDVVFHTYDGLNRRNSTIDLTGGFGNWVYYYHFFSRGWQEIEMHKGGALDRQFVWGLRYIDDLILRDRDADADDQTGELGTPGTTSGLEERLYALQDANWNTVALAETDGDIAERFRYTAYGEHVVLNGGSADANEPTAGDFTADTDHTSDWDWEVLYAGYRYEPLTGQYLVRHRVYDAPLGRWVQHDPLGYVDGMNWYEYVESMPIVKIDPKGLLGFAVGPGVSGTLAIPPYSLGVQVSWATRVVVNFSPFQCTLCDTLRISGLAGVGGGATAAFAPAIITVTNTRINDGFSWQVGVGASGAKVVGGEAYLDVDFKNQAVTIAFRADAGAAARINLRVTGTCTGCGLSPFVRARKVLSCWNNFIKRVNQAVTQLNGTTFATKDLAEDVTLTILAAEKKGFSVEHSLE